MDYKERLKNLKEDYRDKIADETIKMFYQGFEIDAVKSRIRDKYPEFSVADINDIVDKTFKNMSKKEQYKEKLQILKEDFNQIMSSEIQKYRSSVIDKIKADLNSAGLNVQSISEDGYDTSFAGTSFSCTYKNKKINIVLSGSGKSAYIKGDISVDTLSTSAKSIIDKLDKILKKESYKEKSFKERNDEYDDATQEMQDMIDEKKNKFQILSFIKQKYPRLNHQSLKNDLDYLWDTSQESYKEKLKRLKEDYKIGDIVEIVKGANKGDTAVIVNKIDTQFYKVKFTDDNNSWDEIHKDSLKLKESFKEETKQQIDNRLDEIAIKKYNKKYKLLTSEEMTKVENEYINKYILVKESFKEVLSPYIIKLIKLGYSQDDIRAQTGTDVEDDEYEKYYTESFKESEDILIFVGYDVSAGMKHLQKNNIDAKGCGEPGYVIVPNKDAQKAQALAIEWRKTRYESYKEKLTLDDVALKKFGKRYNQLTSDEKKECNYIYSEWSDDDYDEGCKRESWVKSPKYNTPEYTIYLNENPKYSEFKDKFMVTLGRMGKSNDFYVSVIKEGREILNKEFKSFNDAENFAKQYMNQNKESYKEKLQMLKESTGKFSKDASDILDGIVLNNKTKTNNEIIQIIKKDSFLTNEIKDMMISDIELNKYIDDTKKMYRLESYKEKLKRLRESFSLKEYTMEQLEDDIDELEYRIKPYLNSKNLEHKKAIEQYYNIISKYSGNFSSYSTISIIKEEMKFLSTNPGFYHDDQNINRLVQKIQYNINKLKEGMSGFGAFKEDYILVRVPYGKKDTKEEDREYQLNGKGPVGTISEWKKQYPNIKFTIKESFTVVAKNLMNETPIKTFNTKEEADDFINKNKLADKDSKYIIRKESFKERLTHEQAVEIIRALPPENNSRFQIMLSDYTKSELEFIRDTAMSFVFKPGLQGEIAKRAGNLLTRHIMSLKEKKESIKEKYIVFMQSPTGMGKFRMGEFNSEEEAKSYIDSQREDKKKHMSIKQESFKEHKLEVTWIDKDNERHTDIMTFDKNPSDDEILSRLMKQKHGVDLITNVRYLESFKETIKYIIIKGEENPSIKNEMDKIVRHINQHPNINVTDNKYFLFDGNSIIAAQTSEQGIMKYYKQGRVIAKLTESYKESDELPSHCPKCYNPFSNRTGYKIRINYPDSYHAPYEGIVCDNCLNKAKRDFGNNLKVLKTIKRKDIWESYKEEFKVGDRVWDDQEGSFGKIKSINGRFAVIIGKGHEWSADVGDLESDTNKGTSNKEAYSKPKESYEGELTDDDIISKVKQPELLLALDIPKGLNITKNDNLIRAKLKTLTPEERRKLLKYFNLKESHKEASQNITTKDGKKISLEVSGSGTKGKDIETGEDYEKVNNEWKKKLEMLKEKFEADDKYKNMSLDEAKKILGNVDKNDVQGIKKALSMMRALNTEDEEKRLAAARVWLKNKK